MGNLGCDTACLTAPGPLEVASYLRARGWRQEAEIGDKGSIWVLLANGDREEADITLPLRRDLGDFALRMGDVLRTLAAVEQSPETEVLHDLMTISSDLIRVRVSSRDAASGSLPIGEAVAGLSAVSPGEGLDISIAWSRARPPAATVPSRIFLSSDSIPLIQEAARLFKDIAPFEDVELQGFVTRLARGPTEISGEVTLEGLVESQLRRAVVELGEGIYSQAVQAHEQRQRVACTGDLIKELGGYRLQNPRHFRVLEGDDAA